MMILHVWVVVPSSFLSIGLLLYLFFIIVILLHVITSLFLLQVNYVITVHVECVSLFVLLLSIVFLVLWHNLHLLESLVVLRDNV